MRSRYTCLCILVVIGTLFTSCGGISPITYENTNLSVSQVSSARASSAPEGYRIGSSRTDILDNLGDPVTIWDGVNQVNLTPGTDNDKDGYFQYGSLGVDFRIEGDEVKEITLTNADWICSNSLIVGMNIDSARVILGNEDSLSDSSPTRYYYNYDRYGISLEVIMPEGRLDQINITENNAL